MYIYNVKVYKEIDKVIYNLLKSDPDVNIRTYLNESKCTIDLTYLSDKEYNKGSLVLVPLRDDINVGLVQSEYEEPLDENIHYKCILSELGV